MPAERFYIKTPFRDEQELTLEGDEFHHLAHVMRLNEGDEVELVNGQGFLAHATLLRREKKKALFSIQNVSHEEEPSKTLILAQALPRINRLDFIIEKGTELGVTEFWLFPGQQSERKILTDHQIERLVGQTIAAMKQCGRLYLPSIQIKPSLDKWNEKPSIPTYFGDLSESAEPFLKKHSPKESCLFFIGPEAGFSEKEKGLMVQLGAMGVKLHQNILRTDTAALVALSLMSQ